MAYSFYITKQYLQYVICGVCGGVIGCVKNYTKKNQWP